MNLHRPSHALALTIALLTTLTACEGAEPAAPECGDVEAVTPYGIHIGASVVRAAWDEDAGVLDASEARVDCATFTITQPDSTWQVTGTTPSGIDLAPGTYEVEVDWHDGECAYTSEPLVVEVGAKVEDVNLALCADMSGDWTCASGDIEWTERARMVDGCTVQFDALELSGTVRGHVVESEHITAVVGRDGLDFRGRFADTTPVRCWRGEG
jgi:hypothetical protein